MATHSSVLAWKIPGTEEPGTLLGCLWGRTESDTTEVTYQQQQQQHTCSVCMLLIHFPASARKT